MASMDVPKVLADLRVYKLQLDEAIAMLDRLAHRRGEKRGRPLEMPSRLEGSVLSKRRRRRIVQH